MYWRHPRIEIDSTTMGAMLSKGLFSLSIIIKLEKKSNFSKLYLNILSEIPINYLDNYFILWF